MNRLQQKCLIVSAAVHGLLVLVLLLAPAFFTPEKKQPDMPLLYLMPPKIIDDLLTGGTPNVQPHEMRMAVQPAAPTPAPMQSAPPPPPPPKARETPRPEPQPEPAPPPKVAKAPSPIPKIEEEPRKTSKPKDTPKKSEVKVELKSKTVELAKANSKSKTESKSKTSDEDADRKAREREAKRIAGIADAEARRIEDALNGLKNNLLTGTTEIYIPGSDRGFFANYAQMVKSVYDRAWVFNEDLADLRSSVKATITIARDGTVINARISPGGRSGNALLDRSVLDVLQRVKYIAPFPEGAKEVERTFELNFNPATKRANG